VQRGFRLVRQSSVNLVQQSTIASKITTGLHRYFTSERGKWVVVVWLAITFILCWFSNFPLDCVLINGTGPALAPPAAPGEPYVQDSKGTCLVFREVSDVGSGAAVEDYDAYVYLSPTLVGFIRGWLVLNTIEVTLVLSVIAGRHLWSDGANGDRRHIRDTIWQIVTKHRSWYLLADVGTITLLWVLIASQEDNFSDRLVPLLLPILRGPGLATRIQGFWTPLKVVLHSRVARFSIPVLVWMYIMASIGTFCFSTVDDLSIYFRDLKYSLKTVVQIMTFDSWTSIVNRINEVSEGEDGYNFSDSFCNQTFGNIWVYANAVVFGFMYNNMLVAILVEAVNHTSQDTASVRSDGSSNSSVAQVEEVCAELAKMRQQMSGLQTAVAELCSREQLVRGGRSEDGAAPFVARPSET